MSVESLGEALRANWRVRVKCADGKREGMKSVPACFRSDDLDLTALVWTRGRNFPLARLGDRMMCPHCGSRRVSVMFYPPSKSDAGQTAWADPRRDMSALPHHVAIYGPNGSLDRMVAAAANGDVAAAAFKDAVKRLKLAEGETLILRHFGRLISEHPERERRDHGPSGRSGPDDSGTGGVPSAAAE